MPVDNAFSRLHIRVSRKPGSLYPSPLIDAFKFTPIIHYPYKTDGPINAIDGDGKNWNAGVASMCRKQGLHHEFRIG